MEHGIEELKCFFSGCISAIFRAARTVVNAVSVVFSSLHFWTRVWTVGGGREKVRSLLFIGEMEVVIKGPVKESKSGGL